MTRDYMSETDICRAIEHFPQAIGYPGALSLKQVQLGSGSGYVDLVLLPNPQLTDKKLVILEAKRSANRASLADVIGQLLKYYAKALAIGSEGFEIMRARAVEPGLADHKRLSAGRLMGVSRGSDALKQLRSGQPLIPADIDLVVALDEAPKLVVSRLVPIIRILQSHHQLPIRVVTIENGVPRLLDLDSPSN